MVYLNMKISFFARTLVSDIRDPKFAVFFDNNFKQHEVGKRRRGHPRLDWVETTLKEYWDTLKQSGLRGFNGEWMGSDVQLGLIKGAALERAREKGW